MITIIVAQVYALPILGIPMETTILFYVPHAVALHLMLTTTLEPEYVSKFVLEVMMMMVSLMLALMIASEITVPNLVSCIVYLQTLGQIGRPIDANLAALEMIQLRSQHILKIEMGVA